MRWTNEFKVGLFVIIAIVITVLATNWSIDGIRKHEKVYTLHLSVPSADGMWVQSAVKLAGVDIGAVSAIEVEGDHARMDLAIRDAYQLPTDSEAEIRSSGIIGDRFVGILLGDDPTLLQDGDTILLHDKPADFEKIEKQVENITGDLQAITTILRKEVEDDTNRENVEATLANVRALSEELREIAEQNHHDINDIVDSVNRLTHSLEGFSTDAQGKVDEEMVVLKEATDHMNSSVKDIQSITGKIDQGQGTIGALVNDRQTVDLLNDTIDNADRVIKGFSDLHAEVYYTGHYYFGLGDAPDPPFFYGNPLAGGGANTVGIMLMPQEDFWYNFEINDYPQGTVNYTEHLFPGTGEHYVEYERKPDFRMTFEMNKRFRSFSFRLGVKEDGGGLGVTAYLLHDKLELQGDLFDFDLGSYPATERAGLPNLRIVARYSPFQHVYVDVGSEQILLDASYGFGTMLVGAGFHFTDDDIKLLFATLPLSF